MSNIIVHTNPSLYDKSVTLKNTFTLHPRRNKNIFLIEAGLEGEIVNFVEEVKQAEADYQIYESGNLDSMVTLLQAQTIGTQLYIVANWDAAEVIFKAAIDAGFTEDEIQVRIIGEKKRYVYCMKCFQLNEAHPTDKQIQCKCSAMLEVGPFYSKVRKGNIGYPFKPVTQ